MRTLNIRFSTKACKSKALFWTYQVAHKLWHIYTHYERHRAIKHTQAHTSSSSSSSHAEQSTNRLHLWLVFPPKWQITHQTTSNCIGCSSLMTISITTGRCHSPQHNWKKQECNVNKHSHTLSSYYPGFTRCIGKEAPSKQTNAAKQNKQNWQCTMHDTDKAVTNETKSVKWKKL